MAYQLTICIQNVRGIPECFLSSSALEQLQCQSAQFRNGLSQNPQLHQIDRCQYNRQGLTFCQ